MRAESVESEGAPGAGLDAEVRRLAQERDRIETQLKRQAIAYSTVIEIANRINSTGLDLRRIESYTTTMVRGQFGVLRVFLLRQEPTEPDRIRVTVPSKTALGGLDFPSEGPFAAQLLEKARPVPSAEFGPLAGRFPEYESLRSGGVEICVPLLHAGTDEKRELKGVLGLGEKIRRAPFTPPDLELLQVLSDMIAISLNNAALYHRSIVDSLTRVYSRGHFDVHLHQELARARRVVQREENRLRGADASHRFVTLVMLDIDHFKKVNDTHGHPAGDKVLRNVAGILHQAVRTMDIVSRYGGEEFAIVFPETAKADAARIAERLRQRVRESAVTLPDGRTLAVTVSLGVATYPDDAEDMRELVAEADKALYAAKEGGRDRVVVCQGGTRAPAAPRKAETAEGPGGGGGV